MTVLCLHSIDQVRPYAAQLEQLNRASRQRSPFTAFAFVDTYLQHLRYHPDDLQSELWFLLAVEAGRVEGYLVLRRKVERVWGLRVPKLEFLLSHDADCPHLVARPEDEARISAEFYRYLVSRGDEWTFLELRQQRPDSALTPPPADLDLGDYYVRTHPAKETNAVAIRWPDLASYYGALSRKFRQNVRRQVRLLTAEGRLTVVSSMDPRTRPVLFELALIVAGRSWKTKSWVSMVSHPDRLAHFRALLSPEQPMRIWICVVLLDGFPIAASLCGDYQNTFYDLIDLYDCALERVAPGTTLRLVTMRHAIAKQYRAVDLLAGYAYYKSRWLTEATNTSSGQLFKRGSLPWLKAHLGALRRTVAPERPPDEDFNPARRDAQEQDGPARPFVVSPEELRRSSDLLGQLGALPADWLSHSELARAMPFDTGKADEKEVPGAEEVARIPRPALIPLPARLGRATARAR